MNSTGVKVESTRLLSHLRAASEGGAADGSSTRPPLNREAADRLLEMVYEDCRALAASYLKNENAGHTLQPTALAHEVYLRMIDQTRVDWKNRSHFMAIAAQAMRRILIDHARGRGRAKRGGGWKKVRLADGSGSSSGVVPTAASTPGDRDVDVEALEGALARLTELDQRQAKIVEMRFLAGMSVEEVAEALGVSKRTVEGDWTMARAWLRRELEQSEHS